MKRKIFILILVLVGLGLNVYAQSVIENHGKFFVFQNENYQIEIDDIIQITNNISEMESWGCYKLYNGQVFIVVSPTKWQQTMVKIVSDINGKEISPDSLGKELSKGVIIPWDENVNLGNNLGVDKNGNVFVSASNYRGGDSVKVLVYQGYPILKIGKLCLNPVDLTLDNRVNLADSFTKAKYLENNQEKYQQPKEQTNQDQNQDDYDKNVDHNSLADYRNQHHQNQPRRYYSSLGSYPNWDRSGYDRPPVEYNYPVRRYYGGCGSYPNHTPPWWR